MRGLEVEVKGLKNSLQTSIETQNKLEMEVVARESKVSVVENLVIREQEKAESLREVIRERLEEYGRLVGEKNQMMVDYQYQLSRKGEEVVLWQSKVQEEKDNQGEMRRVVASLLLAVMVACKGQW